MKLIIIFNKAFKVPGSITKDVRTSASKNPNLTEIILVGGKGKQVINMVHFIDDVYGYREMQVRITHLLPTLTGDVTIINHVDTKIVRKKAVRVGVSLLDPTTKEVLHEFPSRSAFVKYFWDASNVQHRWINNSTKSAKQIFDLTTLCKANELPFNWTGPDKVEYLLIQKPLGSGHGPVTGDVPYTLEGILAALKGTASRSAIITKLTRQLFSSTNLLGSPDTNSSNITKK